MPNPQVVSQLSTSFAEIQKNNQAFIETFKKQRPLPELAKQIDLPALADIYSATYDKSLVSRRSNLIDTLINNLIQTGRIIKNEHGTVVEDLQNSTDQVNKAIGGLITRITTEPFGNAEMEALKPSFDALVAKIFDQYGINLFYQYLSFQGQVHCPGIIDIYNAISNQNLTTLLNQREEFVKKLIETIFTLYFSTIHDSVNRIDASFDQVNEWIANKNHDALIAALIRWGTNGITQDMQMLCEIAQFMLESIKNKETDGTQLSRKIWERFIQWQQNWYREFGKDVGRDGLMVKDAQYPYGKKISFVIYNDQVFCIENDPSVKTAEYPSGALIKRQLIYTKLNEENDYYAVSKACAAYLRNEYHLNNELIMYIISTVHQGGYVQGYFSLQKNIKPIEGYVINPPQTVPELIFDKNQRLRCIAINQNFYALNTQDRSKQTLLGDLNIVREYPGKYLRGNEPLEHYIPGTFPPDVGKVTYKAKHPLGSLRVTPKTSFEKIKDLKPVVYVRRYPIRASLFFVTGCLVAAVGIAAWPVVVAFLSGASVVAAVATVVGFISALATPVLAGLAAGTFFSGLIGVLLPGLLSNLGVKQPIRLVQENYPEYVKAILTSKKPITVISSGTVVLKQLSNSELDELRMIIQRIKEAFVPNDKAIINDLALLTTKVALLENLKNFLEPLMAKGDTPAKLMTAFESLLDLAKAQSQNTNPKMVEAFISHLESLSLDSLKSVIALMKEKFPSTTPGSSPRSAGSSPGRPEPQKVAPATPTRDASATRRALKESGEAASSSHAATQVAMSGKALAEDHRAPSAPILS